MTNSIAKHVRNVIAVMTKRIEIKGLYKEVLEEMEKPNCYSYLRYPQMYAENECYQCEYLEQCSKESGERCRN